jgi:hypothetical protein
MDVCPLFASAVETLRQFLRAQANTNSIRWIWREDVFTRRAPGSCRSWVRPIYVNITAKSDERLVGGYYQHGVDKGLGVALCVLCIVAGHACCYIYIPENQTDAEYRMMSGLLKCQIPSPPPIAAIARNPLWRFFYRFLIGVPNNAWINDVPSRIDAERLLQSFPQAFAP